MANTVKKTSKKRTASQKSSSSPKVAKVSTKKAFRTSQQAQKWLFERTDYEKQEYLRYNVTTFSLDRMEKLLSLLGNPQKKTHGCPHCRNQGQGIYRDHVGQDVRVQWV